MSREREREKETGRIMQTIEGHLSSYEANPSSTSSHSRASILIYFPASVRTNTKKRRNEEADHDADPCALSGSESLNRLRD